MLPRITAVRALENYRLWLQFSDGTKGEVDLAHLVGKGVFAVWNDRAFFAKAAVDPLARTVCWPGGIDLDPDVLYAKATGKAAA